MPMKCLGLFLKQKVRNNMADIELVVKIDEEDYKEVLNINNRDCTWNNMHSCYEAILNGTPLPKGHGKLIDESDFTPDSDYDDGMFHAVSIGQINSAPTIIEADKTESEK